MRERGDYPGPAGAIGIVASDVLDVVSADVSFVLVAQVKFVISSPDHAVYDDQNHAGRQAGRQAGKTWYSQQSSRGPTSTISQFVDDLARGAFFRGSPRAPAGRQAAAIRLAHLRQPDRAVSQKGALYGHGEFRNFKVHNASAFSRIPR
jgi:hypothetical protein